MIMFFVFSYIINFCINLFLEFKLFLELMKNFNLLTYTDIAAATIEYRIIYFLEYLIPFNSLKGQRENLEEKGMIFNIISPYISLSSRIAYFNSPCD